MDDGQQLQGLPTREIIDLSYINSSDDDDDHQQITPQVDEHIALGYEDLEVLNDDVDEDEADTNIRSRKRDITGNNSDSDEIRPKRPRISYIHRHRVPESEPISDDNGDAAIDSAEAAESDSGESSGPGTWDEEESVLEMRNMCQMYRNRNPPHTSSLNDLPATTRVAKFVQNLHNNTNTAKLLPYTLAAIIATVNSISSEQLSREVKSETTLSTGLCTLVCYIWLAIWQKASLNLYSTKARPVWRTCAVLRRSASVLAGRELNQKQFDKLSLSYMMYWETCWFAGLWPSTNRKLRVMWTSVAWLQAVPALDLTSKSDYPSVKRYLDAWNKEGYLGLVNTVVQDDVDDPRSGISSFFTDTNMADRTRTGRQVLTTMLPEFLTAAITGTLPHHDRLQEGGIKDELKRLWSKRDAPAIYANFIVDRAGVALSPKMMRQVCGDLKEYLAQGQRPDNFAKGIDRLFPTTSWNGEWNEEGLRR